MTFRASCKAVLRDRSLFCGAARRFGADGHAALLTLFDSEGSMPRPEPQSWAWDRLGAAARACYRRGWPRGKRSTAGRAGIDRRPAQEVQRQPGELGAGRQQEQPDSIGADEGLNPLSGVRV